MLSNTSWRRRKTTTRCIPQTGSYYTSSLNYVISNYSYMLNKISEEILIAAQVAAFCLISTMLRRIED